MAYFQVDKNPCKNLETSDDYFEWAKGCYREANAFYKVAIMIIPGLFEPPVRTLRATIPENESHIFR